jgi:hypothetical protein
VLRWLVWSGRGRRLLAGELVPLLRHLLLGAGLPNEGMHSLPILWSAPLIEAVVGVQPWR